MSAVLYYVFLGVFGSLKRWQKKKKKNTSTIEQTIVFHGKKNPKRKKLKTNKKVLMH